MISFADLDSRTSLLIRNDHPVSKGISPLLSWGGDVFLKWVKARGKVVPMRGGVLVSLRSPHAWGWRDVTAVKTPHCSC